MKTQINAAKHLFRMDDFNKENLDLKRKLDSLESSNRSLLSQLRSLQTLVAGKMPKPSRSVTTQTSSCLMVGDRFYKDYRHACLK